MKAATFFFGENHTKITRSRVIVETRTTGTSSSSYDTVGSCAQVRGHLTQQPLVVFIPASHTHNQRQHDPRGGSDQTTESRNDDDARGHRLHERPRRPTPSSSPRSSSTTIPSAATAAADTYPTRLTRVLIFSGGGDDGEPSAASTWSWVTSGWWGPGSASGGAVECLVHGAAVIRVARGGGDDEAPRTGTSIGGGRGA